MVVESLKVNYSRVICPQTNQTLGCRVIFFVDKIRKQVNSFSFDVKVKRLKCVRKNNFFRALESVLSLEESNFYFVEGDHFSPKIRLKVSHK